MMGCRWSATRGMFMLITVVWMLMLVSATQVGQPPMDEDDPKFQPADLVGDSRTRVMPVSATEIIQPAESQAELSGILDDFHDAAAKADYERYFSHWSPASVFLGTDATERWVGQEFRDYAKKRFDTGKGWTYRAHDRHISMAPDQQAGFFDELVTNEKYGTCRGSGVFRKLEGRWWLMQYNLSIPVPNELAERIVGIIKEGAPKAPLGEPKHQE